MERAERSGLAKPDESEPWWVPRCRCAAQVDRCPPRVGLGYVARVPPPQLRVQRETLANFLRLFDEDDLAQRALTTTDEQLTRIRILGAHYAFSEQAMEQGGSMGGERALSLAALDVLEGSGRQLRRARTPVELLDGRPDELDKSELERIRVVRLTAPR